MKSLSSCSSRSSFSSLVLVQFARRDAGDLAELGQHRSRPTSRRSLIALALPAKAAFASSTILDRASRWSSSCCISADLKPPLLAIRLNEALGQGGALLAFTLAEIGDLPVDLGQFLLAVALAAIGGAQLTLRLLPILRGAAGARPVSGLASSPFAAAIPACNSASAAASRGLPAGSWPGRGRAGVTLRSGCARSMPWLSAR